MMRIAYLFLGLIVCPVTSLADSHENFGFPNLIDLTTQRALLGEAFPEIDANQKKLDGLIKYRRDLELYRATHLEEFNQRIQIICEDLKDVERRVNSAYARGDLSPNQKKNYDDRISDERAECSASNNENSKYYRLYDTFLDIYKEQAKDSSRALDKCYASDPCRLREN